MIILPTLIPTQIRSLGGNEQYRFSQRWRCESTCESTAHKKVPGLGRALLLIRG